ncbi:UNKNOWN [Stylonychia lemnae]|uniref:Uncharacterized protein n=1 Tax=Stylonychia lemnae TaxID=5949 RepID=A0A078AMT0_STYLE|nr:UNKNOWN [Stylonychia lemnae]|eukprot:CDW83226.1 UNKNOWN [Stylonychia lemnae]
MKTAFFSSVLLLSAPFFAIVEAVQLKSLTTSNLLSKTQTGTESLAIHPSVQNYYDPQTHQQILNGLLHQGRDSENGSTLGLSQTNTAFNLKGFINNNIDKIKQQVTDQVKTTISDVVDQGKDALTQNIQNIKDQGQDLLQSEIQNTQNKLLKDTKIGQEVSTLISAANAVDEVEDGDEDEDEEEEEEEGKVVQQEKPKKKKKKSRKSKNNKKKSKKSKTDKKKKKKEVVVDQDEDEDEDDEDEEEEEDE